MNVEIITPTETILEEGEELILPTSSGILGIREGHVEVMTPFLTESVLLKQKDGVLAYIVSAGTAYIHPHQITLYTESAVRSHELEEEELQREIDEFTSYHEHTSDPHEVARIKTIMHIKTAQLAAARKRKK